MTQVTSQLNTIAFNISFQGNFTLDGKMVIANQLQKANIPIQNFGLFQAFKITSLLNDKLLIISFVGVINKIKLSMEDIDSVKTIISQYVIPNLGCQGIPQIDILPMGRQFEVKNISLVSTAMFLKAESSPSIQKIEAIQLAKDALARSGYNQSVNCLPIQNGLMVTLLYDLPSDKIDRVEQPLVDAMEAFHPHIGNYEVSWKSSGFSVNL
jgi:hypothetical protein